MSAVRQLTLPWLERVISGAGAAAAVDGEVARLGARRVLIVTGRTLGGSALVGGVRAALGDRCAGVFDGARQHVPGSAVAALLDAIAAAAADGLVSVGGGSPIDAAKAAVHARLAGAADRGLPHVAIPTTLSAGEFTDVAGVTDETAGLKQALSDPRLAPRTVIADPAMTRDTPDWLWAASGMRALDHAVETLYSARQHPVTAALAVRGLAWLVARLPASLGEEPDRAAARGDCQLAAWMAVFGVTHAGFGLSHALGHQIGPRWQVAHGVTSAILLPHVMRVMAAAAPERFAGIAEGLGVAFDPAMPVPGAAACADRVDAFIGQFDLPRRLRDAGVPPGEALAPVAAHVAGVMARAGALDAPPGAGDLRALLDAAY